MNLYISNELYNPSLENISVVKIKWFQQMLSQFLNVILTQVLHEKYEIVGLKLHLYARSLMEWQTL